MNESIKNKIQIDLEAETIGKIDALIESGLYKDRIAFLENAITQLLEMHQSTLDNLRVKKGFAIGIVKYSSKELEKLLSENKKLDIRLIGSLILDSDVKPELADRVINKINMAGVFKASPEVRKILEHKQFSLLGNFPKYALKEPTTDYLDWNEEEKRDNEND